MTRRKPSPRRPIRTTTAPPEVQRANAADAYVREPERDAPVTPIRQGVWVPDQLCSVSGCQQELWHPASRALGICAKTSPPHGEARAQALADREGKS
jgi:hypothetical protein